MRQSFGSEKTKLDLLRACRANRMRFYLLMVFPRTFAQQLFR